MASTPQKIAPMAAQAVLPKRIVPPSDFVAHGVSPMPGAPAPVLTNHGGTVLQSVQVVPIFWGTEWTTGTTAAIPAEIDSFFDFILTSSVIDLLGEYSLPGKPIQHGSRLGSFTITNSEPGTTSGSGRLVTDAQIQTALQGWINNHTLPAVTANTLYFVYLPPNCVCDGPGGTGASCSQFCGYHDSFGSGIYYAVIPFANCNGCVFPGNFLDTLTEVSSHELCEAITDPTLGTWFDPNTGNEIGDICNRQAVRLGNYLVQTEWSNSQTSCAIGPLLAVAGSHLDGYQTSFNNQQHVNFVGTDNHIHELYYDSQWHHNDLTLLAKAPSVSPSSHIDGYQTEFNSQQHVNFIGTDNHVHELYYTNSWNHNDLTAITKAPAAAAGSPIDGYETTFNSQQHVNYLGTDNHVHELYYNGSSWGHNDLTALSGAPAASPASSIDGYPTDYNKQQHVNFLDGNNHVHELYYDGSSWKNNDLTALAGAPVAARGSALDGYETAFNGQEHVNFVGTDNHIHELYYDGSSWKHNDLTALTKAPTAAPGTSVDGYATTFNNQQHINFRGTDDHVHELYYDSSWHHNDLTAVAGAPAATPNSSLDGYQTSFNSQQHVNFIGTDNHIHELYYTNKWAHNDLTDL
jgi:hypothetical protein